MILVIDIIFYQRLEADLYVGTWKSQNTSENLVKKIMA